MRLAPFRSLRTDFWRRYGHFVNIWPLDPLNLTIFDGISRPCHAGPGGTSSCICRPFMGQNPLSSHRDAIFVMPKIALKVINQHMVKSLQQCTSFPYHRYIQFQDGLAMCCPDKSPDFDEIVDVCRDPSRPSVYQKLCSFNEIARKDNNLPLFNLTLRFIDR